MRTGNGSSLGGVALAVSLAGCSGTTVAPPDMGPLPCGLSIVVSPATDEDHPLTPGSKAALSLSDRGGPETRGGTVAWAVSGGALDSLTGHQVGWVVPVEGAEFDSRSFQVSATTAGMVNCPAQTLTVRLTVAWPDNLRTIVIYNPMKPGSEDVARHYATFRKLPADHLCAAPYADDTVVAAKDLPDFASRVTSCVDAVGPWISYLVPVWGVPYKVDGRIVNSFMGNMPVTTSLDALLVFGHNAATPTKPVPSPFYREYEPNTGQYPDVYPWGSLRSLYGKDFFLVARIDGADAQAANDLIDRTEMADKLARAGTLAGTVYVDGRMGLPHPENPVFGSYEWGEATIAGVESVFKSLGKYPVVADYDMAEFGTAPAPLTCPDALYYAGWYSFGHYNDAFTWKPGAIGGHLDSCSACDIRGMTDWSAVALRKGITATFGAVNEPYVSGLLGYDLFFSFLTNGASFGEAAYQSTPFAAWMMVFVGDPLYRPFPKP